MAPSGIDASAEKWCNTSHPSYEVNQLLQRKRDPMKVLFGIVLLPFCFAASRTLWALVAGLQPPSWSRLPLAMWALAGGFLFWLVVYACLPRMVRTYVLAHELTHALWAWLMGARVSKLRVSRKGGSVQLSKKNFIITLAPYFFPLYTVLIILGYMVLSLFFDLRAYEPLWLGLVGFTWGFHLTFTVSTLMTHQPDIQENGRLFSYAVIYLMNVLGICLWIVMVASPTLEQAAAQWGRDVLVVGQSCLHLGKSAADALTKAYSAFVNR